MSARSGKPFALHSRLQNQTFGLFVPHSFPVNAAMNAWGMQVQRVSIVRWTVPWCGLHWIVFLKWFSAWVCLLLLGNTKLESVLNADYITAILTVDRMALQEEFACMYCWVVADFFACSDVHQDAMLGQGSVNQASTCMLALGFVCDIMNSQEALGDAYVHVDAVVLWKRRTYDSFDSWSFSFMQTHWVAW